MTERLSEVFGPLSGLVAKIPLLGAEFAGNALWLWLLALATAALVYGALRLIQQQLLSRLGRLSERTHTIADDLLGTVSHVGLKTTRVKSLSGEQLVFSNSDLLSSRIRNYKRMDERRVVFSFGVLYQTSVRQLEQIPALVQSIIDTSENTRFDRAHFKEFGDSAYVFEVVYYVVQPDYNLYMDCQQRINLELCRAFEERGIEFAYPTRTLHVAADTGPALVTVAGS